MSASKYNQWKSACSMVLFCAATAVCSSAQTYTVLLNFNKYNGAAPSAVFQGKDGNFYGTTAGGGGPNAYGTVFKITPAGKMTVLHRFSGTVDGGSPRAGLVLSSDGNFYGTTAWGGTNKSGTVFKIKPLGKLTTLHSFSGADGAGPDAALLQATDGSFYGTTFGGGSNGDGTIFRITPGGTLTTLYNFAGSDGNQPMSALVQAIGGDLYGTTSAGGANSKGTAFRITPGGTLTVLHSFAGADGSFPAAGLVQGSDGNFYGTTGLGTNHNSGTVFKITPDGTLTTLYSFCAQAGCSDGSTPQAALVQATDGNFYGTTVSGGNSSNGGTIFKITPGGTLTTLHDAYGSIGNFPTTSLIQATGGNLYGSTSSGGSHGYGVLFQLSVGLNRSQGNNKHRLIPFQ